MSKNKYSYLNKQASNHFSSYTYSLTKMYLSFIYLRQSGHLSIYSPSYSFLQLLQMIKCLQLSKMTFLHRFMHIIHNRSLSTSALRNSPFFYPLLATLNFPIISWKIYLIGLTIFLFMKWRLKYRHNVQIKKHKIFLYFSKPHNYNMSFLVNPQNFGTNYPFVNYNWTIRGLSVTMLIVVSSIPI